MSLQVGSSPIPRVRICPINLSLQFHLFRETSPIYTCSLFCQLFLVFSALVNSRSRFFFDWKKFWPANRGAEIWGFLLVWFAARNRGIAIPADLESQIQALFTRSQLVMKHTRHWLSHGKVRRDSMMNLSRDYRSIIEGLQVKSL